jgi:antitoxin (DNA-binding transcriptional repressor) of toxin-antitoxin stability system
MGSTITDALAAEALPRLLDEVEAGGEVVITRGGRAVAKLVRAEAEPAPSDPATLPKRRFGHLADRFPPGLIEEQLKWDKHSDPEWQRMIRIMEGEEEDGPA